MGATAERDGAQVKRERETARRVEVKRVEEEFVKRGATPLGKLDAEKRRRALDPAKSGLMGKAFAVYVETGDGSAEQARDERRRNGTERRVTRGRDPEAAALVEKAQRMSTARSRFRVSHAHPFFDGSVKVTRNRSRVTLARGELTDSFTLEELEAVRDGGKVEGKRDVTRRLTEIGRVDENDRLFWARAFAAFILARVS
jgi:hypothetical protein